MTKINNLEELNAYVEKNGKNLREADLSWANLREADLRRANLSGADLSWANLSWANLREADLRRANLRGSVMRGADLRRANLREADLDYSCWPLWCGSLTAQIDDRIAMQLIYHLCSTIMHSLEVSTDIKAVLLSQMVLDIANRFHRADECGKLELGKGMESRK